MSAAGSSFIVPEPISPDDSNEVDSLPESGTTSSTDSDYDRDEEADREWRESLQQIELFLTMFMIPYIGKYFGRKLAYWGWARYMEWMYPVEVVITSRGSFRGAGAIEAAAHTL